MRTAGEAFLFLVLSLNLTIIVFCWDLQRARHCGTNSLVMVDKSGAAHQQAKSLELYQSLRNCADPFLASKLTDSLNILDDALRLYGPDKVVSSFNGGKDAVVIMHLLRAAVANYASRKSMDGNNIRPKFIYFAIDDEFPEIIEYILQVEEEYGLDLMRFDCGIVKVRASYIILQLFWSCF